MNLHHEVRREELMHQSGTSNLHCDHITDGHPFSLATVRVPSLVRSRPRFKRETERKAALRRRIKGNVFRLTDVRHEVMWRRDGHGEVMFVFMYGSESLQLFEI